ncbi:hypothetical protein PMAYCL1PPCAC_31117, partial [Pristionchus mayeri]
TPSVFPFCMEGFGILTTFGDDDYNNVHAPLERHDRVTPGREERREEQEKEGKTESSTHSSLISKVRDWYEARKEAFLKRRRDRKIEQLRKDLLKARERMNKIQREVR